MKCLVCGKDYEAAECPRCRFPVIHIPGDQQEILKSLKPTIDEYRKNFLKNVQLQVVSYRWKDLDGMIALDREELLELGNCSQLQQGEKWLDNKFARIADEPEVAVTVRVTVAGESQDKTVQLPSLQRAQLQQLGIRMEEDCSFRLLLRNDTDEPTCSAAVPLFA